MRRGLAMVAFSMLVFGLHAPAHGEPSEKTAGAATEAAVAVAIGLAWANSGTIELPVTVEIVAPDAEDLQPASSSEEGTEAVLPPSADGDQPACDGGGCGLSPRWRLFGGRR